jgi:hypothetical protein
VTHIFTPAQARQLACEVGGGRGGTIVAATRSASRGLLGVVEGEDKSRCGGGGSEVEERVGMQRTAITGAYKSCH